MRVWVGGWVGGGVKSATDPHVTPSGASVQLEPVCETGGWQPVGRGGKGPAADPGASTLNPHHPKPRPHQVEANVEAASTINLNNMYLLIFHFN
jgi:hypothetical protein